MCTASVPERCPDKYVKNNEFENGVRSVDLLFVFWFGASPPGSPVVESMKTSRFISCSSTLWMRCLAVPLLMLWRFLGPFLRFEIAPKQVSCINVFQIFSVMCLSLGLKPHGRGCLCKR